PEYGRSTKTEEYGLEITVIKGRVFEISSKNAYIPPDGFVVAFHGGTQELLEDIKFMEELEFSVSLDEEMKNVRYAIGSGPGLIKDGEINVTSTEENFKPNLVYQRAPRTAIAIMENREVVFVTLDGRQKGYSIGMTLKELAEYLKSIGAVDAMNLDGGGSTTLVVEGKVLNRPSDKSERRINGAVIIEKKKK
ncbi:MAG: phosphodiester glycosidase family protein, partial [Candidatus Muiribacteriaceae bacterium]